MLWPDNKTFNNHRWVAVCRFVVHYKVTKHLYNNIQLHWLFTKILLKISNKWKGQILPFYKRNLFWYTSSCSFEKSVIFITRFLRFFDTQSCRKVLLVEINFLLKYNLDPRKSQKSFKKTTNVLGLTTVNNRSVLGPFLRNRHHQWDDFRYTVQSFRSLWFFWGLP